VFVGGQWVRPAGDGVLEVVDSTTEEAMGAVPEGTAADVDRAVAAARAAFAAWSSVPAGERAACMGRVAAGLRRRTPELAHLLARELGMPLQQCADVQVGMAVTTFASMAEADRLVPAEERVANSLVVHEPVGVVGAITPWNYPLQQMAAKVAPALAAGCTVVLKPSEVTPLNAYVLAEEIEAAGVLPGAFNLVSGTGPKVGEALAAHPDVDMVSFTGSTRAGRRVSQLAAPGVKRVTLELGGKSANVILDDADLEAAVAAGVASAFTNSGQACSALSRMLVPRARRAEAEELATGYADAAAAGLGDPLAGATLLGPLVSAVQRQRVRGYIRQGIEQGARLLTGGPEPPEGLERGWFVRPTVFSGVTPDMAIAQDEIFGPVLSILAYDTEDEAVETANGTRYGLSAAVWSQDPERAERVARRLDAGHVRLGDSPFDLLAPFGGRKQSGIGREQGRYGLAEFLEVKAIQLPA
jgi:acyl-CoA reductase-like NAD-dependent aldehyde dehydrogenase